MWRLALACLLACTNTNGRAPTCVELSQTITQRHTACVVAADRGNCPLVLGAWCGAEVNCPPASDWQHGCDGTGSNCTYSAPACTVSGSDASFGMVQTLDGLDGLILTDNIFGSGTCHFDACR